MNRKDLEDYSIKQKWTKARISFLEEQTKNVNRLSSILSDMPKGSKIVYDNEAESLTRLLDQIEALKREVRQETVDMENEIKKQLEQLQPKHGLLLYHYYILGDTIKHIAKEVLHYELKYTYKLRDSALEEFDYYHEKKG